MAATLKSVVLAASAARTTTADGTPVEGINRDGPAAVFLDATAASGTTPTLDVTIEEYDSVSAKWYVIATFAQLVAVGRERIAVADLSGNRHRASWTITGTTPSFTFSVSMNAK